MSYAPSDPSRVQTATQRQVDQQLVRTDLDDVDPELREEFAQRQQKARERLHGQVPEWRRPQHIDMSDVPRSMTPSEREAGKAFNRRLMDMSKLHPGDGLHLTFPQFFDAIEDDPEGFKAWSRGRRQLTLRPDPQDLTN